jgi:hypothetical protein
LKKDQFKTEKRDKLATEDRLKKRKEKKAKKDKKIKKAKEQSVVIDVVPPAPPVKKTVKFNENVSELRFEKEKTVAELLPPKPPSPPPPPPKPEAEPEKVKSDEAKKAKKKKKKAKKAKLLTKENQPNSTSVMSLHDNKNNSAKVDTAEIEKSNVFFSSFR